ncbi:GDSL-type esterase/lipase family protein [Micromonospora sp. NPDC049175]|uniref:GDSL-type esterase/lipase family protein n=1 Tax=Micromonospora sp. NPDC049175 TaxID=3364266 RepID=UPI00371B7533
MGDPSVLFRGAVSVQPGPPGPDGRPLWWAPWRVPYEEAELHLPEGGVGRAAMPSGVRISLRSDSRWLRCRYQADPAPVLNGPQERPRLDVRVDGRLLRTVRLRADGGDQEFEVPLGGQRRDRLVELWLPTYNQFRLRLLEVETRWQPDERRRPRWVHYGSSISQGRGAASPSTAWHALVAESAGWDLTSLALGAACHMQPMTARLMRDLPAEVLTACVGINSQALGSLGPETFTAAVIGFVRTVRERHPVTPLMMMSTIYAPERESVAGPSGLTIEDCRARTARAVELLRAAGDLHVHYLDGLKIFGPSDAELMLEPLSIERLHPGPAGHHLFAERFLDHLGMVPSLIARVSA